MNYVTLFSNASMDKFPTNTTAQYSVELQTPIDVEGAEVALSEISFPTDFQKRYIIKSSDFWIRIGVMGTQRHRFLYFKYGTYKSIYDLYRSLESLNIDVKVICYPETHSITLSIPHKAVLDTFSDVNVHLTVSPSDVDLFGSLLYVESQTDTGTVAKRTETELLGLHLPYSNCTIANYFFTEGRIHLNLHVEEDLPINFVYVHCNIIEAQENNGHLAPLLRVVQLKGELSSFSKYYIKPFYFPLIINRLERIDISLLDEKGDKIPFQSSPSSVVLHFRKRGVAI